MTITAVDDGVTFLLGTCDNKDRVTYRTTCDIFIKESGVVDFWTQSGVDIGDAPIPLEGIDIATIKLAEDFYRNISCDTKKRYSIHELIKMIRLFNYIAADTSMEETAKLIAQSLRGRTVEEYRTILGIESSDMTTLQQEEARRFHIPIFLNR